MKPITRWIIVALAFAAFVLLTWPFIGPFWITLGATFGIFVVGLGFVYLGAVSIAWAVTGRWEWGLDNLDRKR